MPNFFDYVTTGVRELTSRDFIKRNGKVYLIHPETKGKHGLIFFYATWCAASQNMRRLWSDMAQTGGHLFPYLAVNCEANRGIANALKITGYPTFKYLHPDGSLEHYNGRRDAGAFTKFMCYVSDIETTPGFPRSDKHYKRPGEEHHAHPFGPEAHHQHPGNPNTSPYISLADPVGGAKHWINGFRMDYDPRRRDHGIKDHRVHPQYSRYDEPNPLKKSCNPRPQF